LREKQNELKNYQLQLNEFRMKISEVKDFFFFYLIFIFIFISILFSLKVQFIPSNYQISLEHFGHIQDNSCWLKNSLILNEEECLTLAKMTHSTKGNLLYRATRDGFEAQAFHTRCNGKSNTITIIKNNLNYVFGGYASSAWNSSGNYIQDRNAFLFSLRNGKSSKSQPNLINDQPEMEFFGVEQNILTREELNTYYENDAVIFDPPLVEEKEPNLYGHHSKFNTMSNQYAYGNGLTRNELSSKGKFMIKNPQCSLFGNSNYGPTFGSGHDIHICHQSNINQGSYTNFGNSYNLPDGFTYGGNAREFLAGHYNRWRTTEIEVYQIL
jgi:hypothetical protein